MIDRTCRWAPRVAVALAVVLAALTSLPAQTPPGEVTGLHLDATSTLSWDAAAGAADYNVYRGLLSWLDTSEGAVCHGDEIPGLSFATPAAPAEGEGYYYLVTGEAAGGEEGAAGNGSLGAARVLRGRCDAVMRNHLLARTGYGWSEYDAGRIAALGLAGYLDEQLDPASIDESTNTILNARRAALVPPDNIQELVALDVVQAVYARRQLEQQAVLFWDNHFNTDYRGSFQFFNFYQTLFPLTQLREAAKFHYDNEEAWRYLAFNGTFREMIEAMSLSPAMILYLDTVLNVNTVPNENFPRELLELHTMGVDGGYVQQDVVELARVFTGWNVCKKDASVAADPLGACIPRNLYGTAGEPPGLWVSNFRVNLHDTGQKVLFAGTPYQRTIPSTAGNPAAGVNDAQLAFDAILAHPSTPRFIARKLLQRFVTESPSQTMIDAVVAEWNDGTNPAGVGDLREVLRAVLTQSGFLSPDSVGGKIKTPFEHVVSGIRAIRGNTDGFNVVRQYVQRMQEQFHFNPVPTGYPEIGGDWLDTNNLLERQNFGVDAATRTAGALVSNVIALLNENGVSTAPVPNNATAIVDFMAGALFGGALTPSERQRAIDYLNTDDNGVPANYDDARIRETVGFMLGFAQFLEQ